MTNGRRQRVLCDVPVCVEATTEATSQSAGENECIRNNCFQYLFADSVKFHQCEAACKFVQFFNVTLPYLGTQNELGRELLQAQPQRLRQQLRQPDGLPEQHLRRDRINGVRS